MRGTGKKERDDWSINTGVDPIHIHKLILFMLKVLFLLMSISIAGSEL
jgi:hypothetical protein